MKSLREETKTVRHWHHFVRVQNFENQLMTSMMTTKNENYMTKAEIKIMGNKLMTEDSQYQSVGETIGLKIEYPWIIHFSLILYSN